MDFTKKVLSETKFGFAIIFAVWVVFASPLLFFGKTTYPSDYQTNFFQPWSQYPGMGSPVKNNAQPDIIGQIYPWKNFTISGLKNFSIPLWNPYSFAGTPHLANYQSSVLSPINLLYFLPIKFIDAWGLSVIIQPLLAGLFTFFLAKFYKISTLGSTLSGVSFMFCGFMTTWMGYQTLDYAILFLPISILFLEKYFLDQRLRWLVFLSFSVFLSFAGGHFQTSIYFSITLISFIIYKTIRIKKNNFGLIAFCYFLFGLLLASPQILPSLELYLNSVRSSLFQKIEVIPLTYLTTIFSPDFFGNPVTRNDWFGHYAEWNSFCGTIAFSLAFFVALFKRDKNTWFFIALGLLSLLFAFDTPFQLLLQFMKIPVLSTSASSRIIVLFSFSTAILAGYGFDEILKNKSNFKKSIIWTIGLLFLFVSLSLLGLIAIKTHEQLVIAIKNSIFPAITLLLLVFLVFSKFLNKKTLFLAASIILVFFASFEMLRFSIKWQNFSAKENVYKTVPITNFYNNLKPTDRVIGLSGAEDSLYYKVPVLTGYDPLYIKSYGEFIKYIDTKKQLPADRSVVSFPLRGYYSKKALDFLGVDYIVYKVSDKNYSWSFPFKDYPIGQLIKVYDDKYYQVFKNTKSFSRAFLVKNVSYSQENKILERMFQSDLRQTAFLSDKIKLSNSLASGSVTINSYKPNSIKLTVDTTEKQMLVVTDNYYPGWKAYINNKPSKIYRTDYTFRGVIVPTGKSVIEFIYRPASFYIGFYLALLGLLGIMMGGLLKFFKNKNG